MSKKPVIELISGNLGNRLFQFFAAQSLIERFGSGTFSNTHFPEWGVHWPKIDPVGFEKVVFIEQVNDFDPEYLLSLLSENPSTYLLNRSHLQQQRLFKEASYYKKFFPLVSREAQTIGRNKLLINIRTGDILTGHASQYPLVPIKFYEDVIRSCRLEPVFMGQLDECEYISRLKTAFPSAEFLPTRGVMADFDTIRQATNIVPAISTFSLAAAWLSDAKIIHLPLSGFLSPTQHRSIDLIPVEDHRYRFYQFPANYAVPEIEAIVHHEKMTGLWKEISAAEVKALKDTPTRIRNSRHYENLRPAAGFDETFYVHSHQDVAVSISNGLYDNGLHHYDEFGRSRGYQTSRVDREVESLPNLALGRPAWQSSVSRWSRGRGVQGDAMRAVDGNRSKDYGFHTTKEQAPWWIVDFERRCLLYKVKIFNRKGAKILQQRAQGIQVETSLDAENWCQLYQAGDEEFFGEEPDCLVPLICAAPAGLTARYLKISLRKISILHLAEVEVYGIPLS